MDHQRSGRRDLLVYAKTDPAAGARGITAFIVERGMKGFSHGAKLDKLGMRGSDTSELVFADCEVPGRTCWERRHRRQRADERPRLRTRGAAAGPLGLMQAAIDVVLPYVHERQQFDQPIGTFQLVPAKLADMYVTMNAATAYVYAVAKACDRDETTREDAAGAILFSAERATQVALDAIQASAETATPTTTRSGGCCATPSSTRSAPEPAKYGAC